MNYLVEDSTGNLSVIPAEKLRAATLENVTVHGRLMPADDGDFKAVFNEQLNATLLTSERLAVA